MANHGSPELEWARKYPFKIAQTPYSLKKECPRHTNNKRKNRHWWIEKFWRHRQSMRLTVLWDMNNVAGTGATCTGGSDGDSKMIHLSQWKILHNTLSCYTSDLWAKQSKSTKYCSNNKDELKFEKIRGQGAKSTVEKCKCELTPITGKNSSLLEHQSEPT